jgi:hypothetical protein
MAAQRGTGEEVA